MIQISDNMVAIFTEDQVFLVSFSLIKEIILQHGVKIGTQKNGVYRLALSAEGGSKDSGVNDSVLTQLRDKLDKLEGRK
jgi:hypothetical protein